ncbi:FHA domain-containing protein [Ruicaihuangia caeni]|uniref:FHA domain-containing protein n=1 Tax=Ruicaihuangia caeni TaxID=3042517 RepID=UPI00338D918E
MPDDKRYLISVPPGLIPQAEPDVNSGTRKLPQPQKPSGPPPEQAPSTPGAGPRGPVISLGPGSPLPSAPPRSAPVSEPAAPIPAAGPAAEPAAERAVTPAVEPTAVDEGERSTLSATETAPVAVRRWVLALGDGTRHPVDPAVVVGRNPNPQGLGSAAGAGALPLAIVDPERSVSKTHALFQVRDGVLTVLDLDSTNGVVVSADGRDQPVVPGQPEVVPDAAVVSLGRFELRVVSA